MGSFDMNASFSKMPILGKTTVIICLKREIDGETELIPLTYPVVGHYYDYGLLHNFEENEITKAICDFFEMETMEKVIEFIYDMTIRDEYNRGRKRIENGKKPYEEDKYVKYVNILDKLRKNSRIEVKSDEQINNEVSEFVKKIKDGSAKPYFTKHILGRNAINKRTLETYELALFYENTDVFNALCSPSTAYIDDGKLELYNEWEAKSDNPSELFGQHFMDKNNAFCITKDCNSEEAEKIKKSLCRLYTNFEIEGKEFIFEETSILGQDNCNYMWYKYGKAIHNLWRNRINKYSRGNDIDIMDNG